jgi:DNA-binding response OmpR family regulator
MVLGDRDGPFSRGVSSAFFKLGLRDVAVCQNIDELRDSVKAVIDVVVCDVDLPGVDMCSVTQDIRHERLGGNPFMIVIAMARPSSTVDLARVMKSGVDDFLTRPMEVEHVVRKIGAFARQRNPFVVTQGYVGPSRRDSRRADGSDDELVEVPNSLRAKVVEGLRSQDIEPRLRKGRSVVMEKKAGASLRTIARLTQRLLQQQAEHADAAAMARTLRHIADKSDEVVIEHGADRATGHVAAIAARIARLARRAADARSSSNVVEVSLLGQLSEAAVGSSVMSAGSADVAREIVAVVDRFLIRA